MSKPLPKYDTAFSHRSSATIHTARRARRRVPQGKALPVTRYAVAMFLHQERTLSPVHHRRPEHRHPNARVRFQQQPHHQLVRRWHSCERQLPPHSPAPDRHTASPRNPTGSGARYVSSESSVVDKNALDSLSYYEDNQEHEPLTRHYKNAVFLRSLFQAKI